MTTEQDQNNRLRDPEGQDIPTRNLLTMSVISALVYFLLSWLIYHYFHEVSLGEVFLHGFSLSGQLLAGGIGGCIAASVIMYLSGRSPVAEVLGDFYIFRAIAKARFTNFDRFQLSIFAGAGEELLFRGAVQPLLGNGLTSVIFVGIHGYFSFRSVAHLVFSAMMFGRSLLLGVLVSHAGLIAAMFAHAVYDMIMLLWAKNQSFSF